jgi:precorrin-4 methylase
MIVVGRALSREAPVSKLYDPAFSHGFRDGEKA